MTIARRLVVVGVRVYQRTVSPMMPARCKYHPTCSEYTAQAVEAYGILRGSLLGVWRLLRCNPWSHGGYDPVSAQTMFYSPLSSRPSSDA